jgi:hypothetical protein
MAVPVPLGGGWPREEQRAGGGALACGQSVPGTHSRAAWRTHAPPFPTGAAAGAGARLGTMTAAVTGAAAEIAAGSKQRALRARPGGLGGSCSGQAPGACMRAGGWWQQRSGAGGLAGLQGSRAFTLPCISSPPPPGRTPVAL